MGDVSTYSALGIPDSLAIVLALIGLSLALSPFIGGLDFGPLKVPTIAQAKSRLFRWVSPSVFLLLLLGFVPLWPNRDEQQENPPLPVDEGIEFIEDCLPFNPKQLSVRPHGTGYILTEGFSSMIGFRDKTTAERALEIIHHYNMNSHCFVGRPHPAIQYWLVDFGAPRGSIDGEDCMDLYPEELNGIKVDQAWVLTDTRKYRRVFPEETELRTAMKIFRRYEFSKVCTIGSDPALFEYYRR